MELSENRRYHPRTPLADINVTNLVDVVLVLLIIFMITAPMLQSGIDINLPKAKTEAKEVSESATVTITKERGIFINDKFVRPDRFETQLGVLKRSGQVRSILLRADKDVPYGFVVETMAKIRAAGIENLNLITVPEERK